MLILRPKIEFVQGCGSASPAWPSYKLAVQRFEETLMSDLDSSAVCWNAKKLLISVKLVLLDENKVIVPDDVALGKGRVEARINLPFRDWLVGEAIDHTNHIARGLDYAIRLIPQSLLSEHDRSELCNSIERTRFGLTMSSSRLPTQTVSAVRVAGRGDSSRNAMQRLLNSRDSSVRYFEVWRRGSDVFQHTGSLGDRGQTKRFDVRSDAEADEVIENLLNEARQDGFRELDQSTMSQLVLKDSAIAGVMRQRTAMRHQVEDFVDQVLGWTGLGWCDGGSSSHDAVEVFCLVIDCKIAQKVLTEALQGSGFEHYAVEGCAPAQQ